MKTNNITYRRVGDYNIPNLTLPPEETNIRLGKWGMLHKNYMLKNKKVTVAIMTTEGIFWQYLADIDKQADEMYDLLVEQIKANEGLTEQLKAEKWMKWVCQMNNIRNQAMEIVKSELIYN